MKNILNAVTTIQRDFLDTLILTPSDEALARSVHSRFSKLEGSQHIASQGSLRWFVAVLRTFRPKRVLELGAGIGTMTELMLDPRFGVEKVYTTESNDFCLLAFDKNLTLRCDERLEILRREEDLLKIDQPLDLIVGDGGFYSPLEFRNAKAGTILFFDGYRSKLRSLADSTLLEMNFRCEPKQFGRDRKVWRMDRTGLLPYPKRVKERNSCWIGVVTEK